MYVSAAAGSLFWLGRWDEALARSVEAEELAPDLADQMFRWESVLIHCERGELTPAREVFSRATAVGESEESQAVAGYALTQAGLLRAEGRLVESQEAAERALAISRELGTTSPLFKSSLYEALEAALERRDTTRAGELLATLDRLAPGQRTPFLRATQSEFRARLAAALGGGDADTHFAAAEALFRELQIPFYAARVELQHAEWLIAHERADEAHALLTAARETSERLGAAPWLERLEAAEAGAPAETLA